MLDGLWIFSSPEHDVLKGSYYGGPVSIGIVNNSFKYFLLLNRWANLDETWQEYSSLKTFSMKNSGCYSNQMEFSKQLFKNLLLWNRCSDFEMIIWRCFSGYPFQNKNCS